MGVIEQPEQHPIRSDDEGMDLNEPFGDGIKKEQLHPPPSTMGDQAFRVGPPELRSTATRACFSIGGDFTVNTEEPATESRPPAADAAGSAGSAA